MGNFIREDAEHLIHCALCCACAVTSAALGCAMGYRFYRSRKVMPSGLISLLSLGSAAWYANWP